MPPKRGTTSVRPVPPSTSRTKPTSKPVAAPGPASGRRPLPVSRGGATNRRGGRGSGQRVEPVGDQKETERKDKKRTPTQQDIMAIRIQTVVRAFLGRRRLRRLLHQKEEYDELMDKLQREAYLQLVRMERLESERQAEREARGRRRKQQLLHRRKRMLEAAFEGDVDEIRKILLEAKESYLSEGGVPEPYLLQRVEHSLIECTDANNLTPLSEAAAGGSLPASRLLVELGANLNAIGQYGRTPLYRAAFAGHKSVCEYLLSQGADPRIFSEDGSLPQHIASSAEVEQLFLSWDMEETERMMADLSVRMEERKTIDTAYQQKEIQEMNICVEELEKAYKARQLELATAHQELEKRIVEHDTLIVEGKDRSDLTLPAIHDAEGELEAAKMRSETIRQKLQEARLHLGGSEEGSDPGVGVRANIRELDEILMRDVGNKVKDSGKWPLIIDPSSQVSLFLKYRDTNYIDLFNPKETRPESVRLSLLGSIRFGKMLIIDMRDVDMWSQAGTIFNQVQPGLFDAILSSDILKQQSYMSLVRPDDGEEYQKGNFMHGRVDKFRLIVLTKMPYPPEYLLDLLYPITIVLPQ